MARRRVVGSEFPQWAMRVGGGEYSSGNQVIKKKRPSRACGGVAFGRAHGVMKNAGRPGRRVVFVCCSGAVSRLRNARGSYYYSFVRFCFTVY